MLSFSSEIIKFFTQLLKSGMDWKIIILLSLYILPFLVLFGVTYYLKQHFNSKHDEIKVHFSEIKPCSGECLKGILVSLEEFEKALNEKIDKMPHDSDLRDITENIKMLSNIVDTMKTILISWGSKK